MGIPAIGLQSVFAQQAAAAIDDEHHRQLVGAVRAVSKGIFWIWLLMAGVVLLALPFVVRSLQVVHVSAILLTVVVGLFSMWLPVMSGLLQGRQDFLWYGGLSISGGLCRFLAVVVIVYILGGQSPGAMLGVLIGVLIPVGIALWRNRSCLEGPAVPLEWKEWIGRLVPLTLGAGATLFMMSADMLFVQKYFNRNETGFYAAAGMIGRALVFFTAPVAAVMFPKIVRSAATGEKSSVFYLAVGFTALLGIGSAVFCTLWPWLPLRIIYQPEFLKVAGLVPWFAWCMLPITLCNVLVNDLLARKQFKVVPWLIVIAAGYAFALNWRATTANKADILAGFAQVVQVLGVFGLIMLGVCLWFSYRFRLPQKTGK
jgi:O-antigen/teichoic acid export membrane protein